MTKYTHPQKKVWITVWIAKSQFEGLPRIFIIKNEGIYTPII